ncbi:MAG: hypothetical protein ABI700_16940 [Chloroflexota bacterium]
MKPFGSCLTFIFVGLLLFVTGYYSAQHTIPTLEQPVLTQPSPTPVWAMFPESAVTPYVTEAIYQPFERGFMLWRADENCIYAIVTDAPLYPHRAIIPLVIPGDMIHSYGYCLTVAPLTDRAITSEPPPRLDRAYGRTRHRLALLRRSPCGLRLRNRTRTALHRHHSHQRGRSHHGWVGFYLGAAHPP